MSYGKFYSAILLLLLLVALVGSGCSTFNEPYKGDVALYTQVKANLKLDWTYLRVTPERARLLAAAAAFNCNRNYGPSNECNHIATQMMCYIQKAYAKNPVEGCQAIAVFRVLVPHHMHLVFETTEGDMYFENDGREIPKPKIEYGRYQ